MKTKLLLMVVAILGVVSGRCTGESGTFTGTFTGTGTFIAAPSPLPAAAATIPTTASAPTVVPTATPTPIAAPAPTNTMVPTATGTPPVVSLAPGANLARSIASNPVGTKFNLGCGTYRFAIDNGSLNSLTPLAGSSFVGAGAVNGVPTSPPCAHLSGAIRLPDDSPDKSWHFDTNSKLWYNTVGMNNTILSIPQGAHAGGCQLVGQQGKGTGIDSAPPYWIHSKAYSMNAKVLDSNGNVEQAVNGGTSGAVAPANWASVVGGTTQDASVAWRVVALANTMAGTGACSYPQDLFSNGVMQPRTIVWPPIGNFWYLDGDENRAGHGRYTVYVASDPTANVTELQVVQEAFGGNNNNVTLQNLTIEKFASLYQVGAVCPAGDNVSVLNNWLSHNHSKGVEVAYSCGGRTPHNAVIKYNEFLENGQAGIGVGGDIGSLVDSNRLDRNGEIGMVPSGEGGNKWSGTNDVISSNTVNYENGVGLWCDMGSPGIRFANNVVTGSTGEGVRLEIATSATVTGNRLVNNDQLSPNQCVALHVPPVVDGFDNCIGAQAANGTIAAGGCAVGSDSPAEADSVQSGNSNISNNTISSNCACIMLNTGTRNSTPQSGMVVSHNSITYTGTDSAIKRVCQATQNSGGNPIPADTFDYNNYHFTGTGAPALTGKNWMSGSTLLGFAGWQTQAVPQDQHSTATAP